MTPLFLSINRTTSKPQIRKKKKCLLLLQQQCPCFPSFFSRSFPSLPKPLCLATKHSSMSTKENSGHTLLSTTETIALCPLSAPPSSSAFTTPHQMPSHSLCAWRPGVQSHSSAGSGKPTEATQFAKTPPSRSAPTGTWSWPMPTAESLGKRTPPIKAWSGSNCCQTVTWSFMTRRAILFGRVLTIQRTPCWLGNLCGKGAQPSL